MKSVSKFLSVPVFAVAFLAMLQFGQAQTLEIKPLGTSKLKDMNVLLFQDDMTGEHNSAAMAAEGHWKEFSKDIGFKLTITNRASDMNVTNLRNFQIVVFNYTRLVNEKFNSSQQQAFQGFIEGGGHCVGYHTASMPRQGDWEWYRSNIIIGSYNPNYHGNQIGKMVVTKDQSILDLPNSKNILTGMPDQFQSSDEWYAFNQGPFFAQAKVLYYIDESSLKPHTHNNLNAEQMSLPVEKRHPIMWYRESTNGSRIFYTGIIHTATGARSDFFKLTILRAAEFVAGYNTVSALESARFLREFPERMRIITKSDLLTVKVDYAGEFTATLRDLRGNVVATENFNTNELSFERGNLPSGNYLLQISSQGKAVTSRLINWF